MKKHIIMVFHVSFDGRLGVERLAEDEGEFLLVPRGVVARHASAAFVCFGERKVGRVTWTLAAIEHLAERGDDLELAFSGLALDRLLGPSSPPPPLRDVVVVVHTADLVADMRGVLTARKLEQLRTPPLRRTVVATSAPRDAPRIFFVAADRVSTTARFLAPPLSPPPPKKRVRFLEDGAVSATTTTPP